MITKAEYKILPVRDFAGLELEPGKQSRPVNSWARLENFTLFVSGAIQRMKGLLELIDHKYDSPVIAIVPYRRTPSDDLLVLGLGINGQLYNLETGEQLIQFPVVNYAFTGIMPGIDGGLSSDDPQGPFAGEEISYFLTTAAGYFVQKWNGVPGTAPVSIGVDPPLYPVNVIPNFADPAAIPPVPIGAKFIDILSSRVYCYTFWNPTTRHESSPSPFVAIQKPYVRNPVILGSDVPTGQSLYSVQFQIFPIFGDVAKEADLAARGYTRVRFYATRDGGTEFFLCTNTGWVDNLGNVYLADSDNSVPLTIGQPLYFDGGFPTAVPTNPIPGPTLLTNIISPTPDPSLVQPAPQQGENDPPPTAIWGAVYQGRLWLVTADETAKLVFSKSGDFQSFPIDNFIEIPANEFDPITAVDGEFQQLVIGKKLSTQRLIGSDLTDFVLTPLDPAIGFEGRRAIAHFEGAMFFFSQIGIMRWQGDQPDFYGRSVVPLTDVIPNGVLLERIVVGTDSTDGFILFSTIDKTEKEFGIIVANSPLREEDKEALERPFSTMTGIDHEVMSFGESILKEDNEPHSLVALKDCRVYKLFENLDAPPAFAATQLLPQDDPYSRKVFHCLKNRGEQTSGFEFEVLIVIDDDGNSMSYAARRLRNYNFLGVAGKQIQITFIHRQPFTDPAPILSNFVVEYSIIGEGK